MPSALETALARHRAALAAREGRVIAELIKAYSDALDALGPELRAINALIADATAAGETVSLPQLIRSGHLKKVEGILQREIGALARQAASKVSAEQVYAIELAGGHAVTLGLASGAAPLVALQPAATEALLATLQEGGPLRALFSQLPRMAAEEVAQSLIESVVLGRNPRRVAARVSDAIGGNLARASTISRTETLRAYREGVIETYRKNAAELDGWVWISAADDRTCSTCWAMHGEVFPLDEPFGSHPNCRCSAAPLVKNQPPPVVRGETLFAQLDDAAQLRVLGGPTYRA
ncbi:MAG: minor capsid protein, partial [Burkholderiaceae bacterium]